MSSVRLSVTPSVCPSVCDVGGSGSHWLGILKTNCRDNLPNTFALRSPKAIHLLPGEHGGNLGRLEVGWEKVACWSTKAAISLKRVKIEEKLLWRAYIGSHKRSFERYHRRPSTAFPSPRLGVRNPTPKLQLLLSQERLSLKPVKNFGEKGAWGISRDGPNFLTTPISQERA